VGGWRGEPQRANQELEISVGCRRLDGVDRGASVDEPDGPVAVLERAWRRAFVFLKKIQMYLP
jgi:hypothetical protein